MAKLGIKCLPILSHEGRVEGLLTARDISDFGLSAKEKGGKEAYLNDISQRVGLSSNTSMADPPTFLKAHLALEQTPLFVNIGESVLPHPFKTHDGVGRSQRGVFASLFLAGHYFFDCRCNLRRANFYCLFQIFNLASIPQTLNSLKMHILQRL